MGDGSDTNKKYFYLTGSKSLTLKIALVLNLLFTSCRIKYKQKGRHAIRSSLERVEKWARPDMNVRPISINSLLIFINSFIFNKRISKEPDMNVRSATTGLGVPPVRNW